MFLGAVREVASQFDRRNGNDHFTARLIPQNEQLIGAAGDAPTGKVSFRPRSGMSGGVL